MAKVSIIIPTYNVEMYLVECMDSVVNQTLKDIEIICINDGSTDSSLEILKGYAEKDDRIIIVDPEILDAVMDVTENTPDGDEITEKYWDTQRTLLKEFLEQLYDEVISTWR